MTKRRDEQLWKLIYLHLKKKKYIRKVVIVLDSHDSE